MKRDGLEISILRANDKNAFSLREVHGVNYVVAEPDTSYIVMIHLHDPDGKYRNAWYQVRLHVDGIKSNYTYVVKPDLFKNGVYTCIFKGFKMSDNKYHSFLFSKTLDCNPKSTNTTNEKIGSVEVELLVSETKGLPSGLYTLNDDNRHSVSLIEQIKFWRQANLYTSIGDISNEVFKASNMYYNTVGIPLLAASLRYQTNIVLNLLQSAGTAVIMSKMKPKARMISDLTDDVEPSEKKQKVSSSLLTTEDNNDNNNNSNDNNNEDNSSDGSIIDLVDDIEENELDYVESF